MVFTNAGAEFVALLLGSNIPNKHIISYGIGSGSGTATITDTELIGEEQRRLITGNPSFNGQVTSFQGDFNTVQMSGITLQEFGLFDNNTISTGSLWFRQDIPPIVFDGTNELQISTSLKVIAESGT